MVAQTRAEQRLAVTANVLAKRSGFYSAGFTIVELMIGMVLGLALVAGMATVFSSIRQSAELNEAIADLQENARYIVDTLNRETRMAGFQGCISNTDESSATIRANNAPTADYFRSALTGSRVTSATAWTPAPPATFTIPVASSPIVPVLNSDVLSLQFGHPATYQIQPMAQTNSNIVLTNPNRTIGAGDLVLISNCQVADLFRVTAVAGKTLSHTTSGNSSDQVSAQYGQGGVNNLPQLMKFEANVYFIADTGRTNESGDAVISLYRQTLPFSAPPQEIVEGVEHFKLKFGIRSAGGNLRWVEPNTAGVDFTQVESIQIGLLLTSYDRILTADDDKGYLVAGEVISPAGTSGATWTHAADRRMRMAFNSTVSIRNRRWQN